MSFQTGLSGLNAASKNLDVIGHNISNANTTGMKASRAEFSELIASSMGAVNGRSSGIGVEVAAVAQQFTQGSISTTGNSMDAAINGSGFFQLAQADGSLSYTRDGSFKLDKNGYIKTNNGAYVMGFPTTAAGITTSRSADKLQVSTGEPLPASQTAEVKVRLNLDARAAIVKDPNNPIPPRTTYGTSINVYDKQGLPSPVQLYFEKTEPNKWQVFLQLNTNDPPVQHQPVATIEFDESGKIKLPTIERWYDASGKVVPRGDPEAVDVKETVFGFELDAGTIASANPNGGGTIPQPIVFNFGEMLKNPDGTPKVDANGNSIAREATTQFGSAFAVSDMTQDGYTSGELTGMTIGDTGLVTTRYSNGQTKYTGQIVLADFRNVQGLVPLGNNAWASTVTSGPPVVGTPGSGKFGVLRTGALEDSNVDLTAELVNMMTAQRSYQANAQTIKTQDQVIQTVVNLR